MKNILTIDLEEWFHANYHEHLFDNTGYYEIRIVVNTLKLLEHFSKYNAKATFFVLGYVAEKHPELVKEIYQRGHEVASHGYAHELIHKQSRDEFRYDVQKSMALIEDIINDKVKGYRAPSWSIAEKSLWALEILEELGLVYDASVFPIKTYLYGIPSVPRFKYKPEYNDRKLEIYEIPMSTVRIFNKNIPFSGGFYFRLLPYQVVKTGIRMVNKENNPAIIYLHPREIDTSQPRLKLNFAEALIHYIGIRTCEDKLLRMLKEFEFISIEEYYRLGHEAEIYNSSI